MTLFKKSETTIAEPQTSSEIRAELAKVNQHAAQIQERLSAAREAVGQAEQRYGELASAFAMDPSKPMPTRDEALSAQAKVDALVSAQGTTRQRIAQLTSALAAAEQQESFAQAKAKLPALNASGEACIEKIERAFQELAGAEMAAFNLLFGRSNGLRQAFPDQVTQREADILRHALKRKLLELSVRYRCPLDPKFDTDGNPNFGDLATLSRRIPENYAAR